MTQTFRATLLAGALALAAGMAAAKSDVTIGFQLEPPNLDPTASAAAAIDSIVYANIFQGLTRFDSNGGVIPSLAESWDISEDGKVYTFHLKSGVTYSDGTEFEATDVVHSITRAKAPDSTNPRKSIFEVIDKVEAVDPLTVRITLKRPKGGFLFDMARGDAVIIAPESAATNVTNPVGTGPYRLEDWVKGDKVVLVARDDFWGEKPAITRATFRFISDPTAAFAAMMSGDLDYFPAFPAPENLPQFEADPRFRVTVGTTEGETILSTNNKMPPLDDVRVREAIAHAINRQEVIDGAYYGYGTPIGTHFAPHNPDYVDLTALSNYDPEKSKALLAEAGYPDGFTTTLKLPPPSYARRGGEIIAAQLAKVGIKVEISNLEWAQWLDEVYKQTNYGLSIVSHVEPFDIGIYARKPYYFNYDSPEFDAIYAELDATSDPAKRHELLVKAQEKIARDYVNGFLFQLPLMSVSNAKLQGLWVNAPAPVTDLAAMSWAE
ncbi:MAG: ABC transporter substrate-binding protein [Alphaproteobacteria bacterium]|nr:MAG: ABC transporter substrate-binding protein [Alphaproteobacteria bacterium]